MSRSSGWLAITVVGLTLAATGCGNGTQSRSSDKSGQTLVVDTTFDAGSEDPANAGGPTARLAINQMYQTLMLVDQQQKNGFAPDIAQSYTVSSDGLNYTYNLRHDVKFSDGTPLTSADVVFSLMRNKNIKGIGSFYMAGLTATAKDDYTVVISSTTSNPSTPYLLAFNADAILNSKVVIAHGGSDAPDASTADNAASFLMQNSAGSGPYVLVSNDPQSQIVLTANQHYWGPKPAYGKVVVQNVPPETQALNIETNPNSVALDLSPTQVAGLNKSKTTSVTSRSAEIFLVALNVNPNISRVSSNQDFRSAVRYAIDYKALVSLAGPGVIQAPGILPEGFPGALTSRDLVTRDLTKAKNYLSSSGLQSPTIPLEYPSDLIVHGISFGDIAQEIQINLKDIGIAVNLVPENASVWKARWFAGKIPMFVYSLGGTSFDPATVLLNYAPTNRYAGWDGYPKTRGFDQELDSVYAKIVAATTIEQRVPLLVQAQMLLNDRAAYFPILQGSQAIGASNGVGGLNINQLGDVRLWQIT